MNRNFQNKVENTKSEVGSFFIRMNINRKYAIVFLMLVISVVTILVTLILLDPTRGMLTKTLATLGGFLIVILLFLVSYILSSEIRGINKSSREVTYNEKKIRDRLTRPISLYYTNKVDVENNYQHYFGEVPTTKQIERHREIDGGVQMPSGIPGVSISGKNISIDKGEVDIHHPNMVRQFLLAAINKGDILFGIEDNTIDLTELNEFNELISKLEPYVKIPEDDKILATNLIKQKAAKQSLNRFKFINHNVLLECEFIMKVEKNKWTCTYKHPVNDFLDGGKVEIIMRFNKEGVANNVFFRDGHSKSMVVYGRINGSIDPEHQRWVLELNPIAIF